MKSHISYLRVFIVLSLVFLQGSCFAEIEQSVCSLHYSFDGLKFPEFYPEKISYMQGDEVRFSYSLDNRFGGPLVEGAVKALVLYRGAEDVDRQEDDDIVDDLFVLRDVSILDGDGYSGNFVWNVPENALPGIYVVNLYFPVKKKFNVAGLTFMTSVPAAVTSFEVAGVESGAFMLDKSSTSLNGEPYGFRMPSPKVGVDTPVEIRTSLSNPSGGEVDVDYLLFNWDDVEEELSQYAKSEKVSGSSELVYNLPGLPVGVYVARITASAGDWKSILKVRFTVKGAKARLNWAGLDHFPLATGDESVIGLCFGNSAAEPGDSSVNFTVKGKVSLVDADGNVLLEEEFSGPVTAAIDSRRVSFVSPGDYTKLTLKAALYDESGDLMDEVELVYDYSKFLNIEKQFTVTAPAKASDSLAYVLKYVDVYGDALAGDFVVYLTSPGGKVVRMEEGSVSGSFDGEFMLDGLTEGSYVFKAVVKDAYLSDEMTVDVEAKEETGPVTTTTIKEQPPEEPVDDEQGQDFPWVPVIAGIIIVAVVIYILNSRRNK